MYSAKSIAATGLKNQQLRLDTIAHNVANVNTVGFKTKRLDFKDALYVTGLTPPNPRSPAENQQKGHGVMVAHVVRNFRPGALVNTGHPFDLSIEGEGFFSLLNPNGDIVYTRNGNKSLSVEEDGSYFVNSEGFYFLDINGERIAMPPEASTFAVDIDGTIRFLSGQDEVGRSFLGVFTFQNLHGLAALGDANYMHDEAAGDRLPATGAVIRQGFLEGSNVDLGEEMTRIIRTQRAYQLASRALTTADEMEGVANNMKR
ncbi:MAG: flagellar hook-basal body protein [Oscillospiraceae bacterium]|jgi:flagellar basal-body rod protein FlgG|nr:flagellar hook-basal body protein [Oscillospiraceae bacterium]